MKLNIFVSYPDSSNVYKTLMVSGNEPLEKIMEQCGLKRRGAQCHFNGRFLNQSDLVFTPVDLKGKSPSFLSIKYGIVEAKCTT